MSSRTVISKDECQRLRAAYSDGQSVGQIADDFEYTSSAVRRHVHDYCAHSVPAGGWGSSGGVECPFCGESVRHLPGHLPGCAEAETSEEEPQHRPTGDWEW
ncbi:hypothetical protein ACFQE8_09670 [Salinirubellus sp. GCM10025818]|uniref:hypothetical protein n=1 Tax=Salinirubellus TaxID=2162630 RepID=UPI0030CE5BD5